MSKKRSKRISGFIAAVLMLLSLGITTVFAGEVKKPEDTAVQGEETAAVYTARPSVDGQLRVEGTQLVNQNGKPVSLRGVSTHGLTWFPDFVDPGLFSFVSSDWNCNLFRLAMYSETYCNGEEQLNLELMEKGINAAIAADSYVIVDWHILQDNNPNIHKDKAAEFFSYISTKYAGVPNLIYEICNEPNGSCTWQDVMDYSKEIIPVIRQNSPEAVVLVGTPNYDRMLTPCIENPLNIENVMYVLHFYAADHKEDLRSVLTTAEKAGLPVFISECGLTEETGDGKVDYDSSARWFTYLSEKEISFAVWSFSNKTETSAMFQPAYDPKKGLPQDKDLSNAGRWIRSLIRGTAPNAITEGSGIVEKSAFDKLKDLLREALGDIGTAPAKKWPIFAGGVVAVVLLTWFFRSLYRKNNRKKNPAYGDLVPEKTLSSREMRRKIGRRSRIQRGYILTVVDLCRRIAFSIPAEFGALAIVVNVILLIVEAFGFAESLVLYANLMGMKDFDTPKIPKDAWPDVDIFIATYNEPVELLRKTVNGCVHLDYPDKSKVHIWICDDNKRPAMRELAEEMKVGYFDRPDHEGAKAGNLNHAMSLTSAPYIVTLDADMIPQSCFLKETIPYFVDLELRQQDKPESERTHLGLLQTPQCFYDPDVFQHALYSEKRAPNEQDFFYRTIEVAKTSTNSVIYGGSNTVLSRRALEDIGGFYTKSITEDFATGVLIESSGYVSLALPDPLASGQTPHTFKEHIQQRRRWGRGVIATTKQLRLTTRKGLNFAQRLSYWSSAVYWYSPIKNLIYMMMPLLYACFAIPVLKCNYLDLLVFWLPMFAMQDVTFRVISKNRMSVKWSGIYETSVMAHLLIPIVKEFFGITMSTFQVTDKSGKRVQRPSETRAMIPFLILIGLTVFGIIRVLAIMNLISLVGSIVLLFWLIRNLYYLIMAVFLINGRDSDLEAVNVIDAEFVTLSAGEQEYGGVTTFMTEHNLTVYLDEGKDLQIGTPVTVDLDTENYHVTLKGVVTHLNCSSRSGLITQTIEILDFGENRLEYLQILYDRVPSLPQSYNRDFGIITHMWQNIAYRVARTTRK